MYNIVACICCICCALVCARCAKTQREKKKNTMWNLLTPVPEGAKSPKCSTKWNEIYILRFYGAYKMNESVTTTTTINQHLQKKNILHCVRVCVQRTPPTVK